MCKRMVGDQEMTRTMSFVCHALTINQKPIMFGILNDFNHSNDMFIVCWKLPLDMLSGSDIERVGHDMSAPKR